MTSQADLCNMALTHCHANATIQSISEGTTESNACQTYYDMILNSMMRDHPFNFANSYELLALNGTAVTPWLYRYAYPTDCLRIIEIVNPAGTQDKIKYEIYQDGGSKFILTNQENATLKFTETITDPNRFDASFIAAFTWILAYHISGTVTGSKEITQKCLTIAANMWSAATTNDSNEGEPDVDESAEWIVARTGASETQVQVVRVTE